MRIYFDTSAINQIAKDSQKNKIVRNINKTHKPIISVLNIAELIATIDTEYRFKLFNVLSRLLEGTSNKGKKLLKDEPSILISSLEEVANKDKVIEYFQYEGGYSNLPFVNKPHSVRDGTYLDLARNTNKSIERKHLEGLRSMRVKAQDEFKGFPNDEKKYFVKGRANFFRNLISRPKFLEDFIINALKSSEYKTIYEVLKGRELEIIKKSEPWRFHFASFFLESYNRLYQKNDFGHKTNPGWIDTKQAVYLGATDIFVTADQNQKNYFRFLSKFALTPKRIWSYENMKNQILNNK